MSTPKPDNTVKEIEIKSPETENDDNLSVLSDFDYDPIDKMKFNLLGQYTCDECNSIPKIINLDSNTKTIMIECEDHGLKKMDINAYLCKCLNYSTNNWKCSKCENVQRNREEMFKYCECGKIFCSQCIRLHQTDTAHKNNIDSNLFNLRCKKAKEHFEESYTGYCHECKTHFCKLCENEHKWHAFNKLNEMAMKKAEVDKIKELNKEYERLISFYQGLIKLNKLIIHSYNNFKNNYFNLRNINTMINMHERNKIVYNLNDFENKAVVPGENNMNLYSYMKKLHKFEMKEQTERIDMSNKYFNDFDFKVLTQIPLKNIRFLALENNSISQIDCLKRCDFTNLVILNLSNNAIKDISALLDIKFPDIQAIFLRNNCIKEIIVFGKKKFPSLRQLDLRDNLIEDIKVFNSRKEYLPDLQSLYLTNNAYDRTKCESIIASLDDLIEKEF